MKALLERFEAVMAAAAFAEEGQPEVARSIVAGAFRRLRRSA